MASAIEVKQLTFEEATKVSEWDISGTKAAVDTGAGYLIKALEFWELAGNDERSEAVARSYQKTGEAYGQQAEAVGQTMDLVRPLPNMDGWMQVIRITAVEFLDAVAAQEVVAS